MSTYIFFNVPTTGHVDPTLPVAAELVQRGHEVTYFLTEAYRERVEATGATYRPYQGIEPDFFDAVSKRFNPTRLAAELVETAVWLAPLLAEAIEMVRPQVVIYDSMCPWGRIAARQANLPAVASMALLEMPPRYLPKSGELMSALAALARGLPWLPRYRKAARTLQKDTGVAMPSFVRVINWPGDHNICYTARMLQPDPQTYGEDYTFVGPPLVDVADDISFPFDELAGDLPLIYVTLGTVFNNNPDFFRSCITAFADSEVQIVVSTGGRLGKSDLEPLPGNAIVREYVPQQAILQRASLMITHSGANSVHQALYHDVPLLLVPQQLEQALVAARVAELGAGLMLNRRRVTAERVNKLAIQLLDNDSFKSRAAALGLALREAGGAARAADALEGIAAGQKPAGSEPD